MSLARAERRAGALQIASCREAFWYAKSGGGQGAARGESLPRPALRRARGSLAIREISGLDYAYRVRYITGSVKITFYRTAGGASPVEKYLVDLDSKERAAVADALKAIEISGLRAAGVRTRQIKGKLWEIKASQQRVFYVVVMGGEMVLLHAAKKEGQKADRGDVETAELRFREVTGKRP